MPDFLTEQYVHPDNLTAKLWALKRLPAQIVRMGFVEEYDSLPLKAYPRGSFIVDIEYEDSQLGSAHLIYDSPGGAAILDEFGINTESLEERMRLVENVPVRGIIQVAQSVGIEIKQ